MGQYGILKDFDIFDYHVDTSNPKCALCNFVLEVINEPIRL